MRAACCLVALLALCLSTPADAGAWPRDRGGWFVSLDQTRFSDHGRWTGLYAEYGLTRRLTFGIDAGRGRGAGNWTALAFLRRDLTPGARVKLAAQFGIGRRGSPQGSQMLLRTGLALGRGFDSRLGPGWVEAEAQRLWSPGSDWRASKLDLTAGVRLPRGRLAYLQIQTADYPGGPPTVAAVPTLVQRFGPVDLQLALSLGLVNRHDRGVKLGLWARF